LFFLPFDDRLIPEIQTKQTKMFRFVVLFFACFVTISNGIKFSYWTYYSNANCDSNNGYDIAEVDFVKDSGAVNGNCTITTNDPLYKSYKRTLVESDTWPSIADLVPSKSLYYTVMT
jgi:hypothetical protein